MKSNKAAVLDDAGTTSYLEAEELRALHLERAPVVSMPVAGDPVPARRGDPVPGKPQGDPVPNKPGVQRPGDPMANTPPRQPGQPAKGPQRPGDPMACQGKCR